MDQLSFDDLEVWLPVVGMETRYEVSSHGHLRSLPAWRSRSGGILKPSIHTHGYLYHSLRPEANGPKKRFMMHVLVAEAFIGKRPPGQVVRHKDDDPTNNHVGNLLWGTQAENGRDATRNGRNHNANKTHCPQRHEFTPENTYIAPDGGRGCRKCMAASRQRRKQRLRGELAA